MQANRIALKLSQAGARQQLRVQAGADPVVAGWQCLLEGMLIRLEDYLVPGRLVTFQSVAPDEKVFFEDLTRAVAIPPTVRAVFIPPSVLQGMLFSPDSGPAPARIPSDSGIVLASRGQDYSIVLNTFFAGPPYAAGIDVYEDGRLLAGYSFSTVSECRDNLARIIHTYLRPRRPAAG